MPPVTTFAKIPRREARSPKSERRIEELLALAREVFAERGFAAATTAEIAQRAGVAEATVFSYFGSKRELCIAVVRRWYDELSAELEAALPAITGTRERVFFLVQRHLANLTDDAGLCALILGEGRGVDREFSELLRDLKRRYTAPLMQALRAGIAAGELRDDAPVALMRDMVYGSMEHVLWGAVASGRKPPLQSTAEALTALLLDAFAAAPPELRRLRAFHAEVDAALRRSRRDG